MTRPLYQTEAKIRAYWATTSLALLKDFLDMEEPGTCMACGIFCEGQGSIHRAHIVARINRGSDDPSNLHMLCPTCHDDSEFLTEEAYWQWFWERTTLDMMLSIGVASLGRNLSKLLR